MEWWGTVQLNAWLYFFCFFFYPDPHPLELLFLMTPRHRPLLFDRHYCFLFYGAFCRLLLRKRRGGGEGHGGVRQMREKRERERERERRTNPKH